MVPMSEPKLFRADEILEMAVQIEKQGIDFYRACSRSAGNPQAGKVFAFLIDQEKSHLQTFRDMQAGFEHRSLPESYPGEMRDYLSSLVKGRVFREAETEKAADDAALAIRMALDLEERSILFYSAMRNVGRSSDRHAVERVIAEEHNHIRRLLSLRKEMGVRPRKSPRE
jgi:rubrerythrin